MSSDNPQAKPVLVEWLDAGMGDTIEEACAHRRVSCGYMLRRVSQVGVWLGIDNEDVRHVEFIPWGMVERVVPLIPAE